MGALRGGEGAFYRAWGGADRHGKLGTDSGIRSNSATAGRRTPAASRTRARSSGGRLGTAPTGGVRTPARPGGRRREGRWLAGSTSQRPATGVALFCGTHTSARPSGRHTREAAPTARPHLSAGRREAGRGGRPSGPKGRAAAHEGFSGFFFKLNPEIQINSNKFK